MTKIIVELSAKKCSFEPSLSKDFIFKPSNENYNNNIGLLLSLVHRAHAIECDYKKK